MKYTVRIMLLCIASSIKLSTAQPVLNKVDVEYKIGESIIFTNTNYVSEGSDGPNQTWNLSSIISGSTNPYTCVNPTTTPSSSSFPTASVALSSTGGFGYYNISSTAFQILGLSGNGTLISYNNPEDFLRFPCEYGDSYTDTWSTTFVSGGGTYYRTGTSTVEVDGYGTLLLPGGKTYQNTLRVRVEQVFKDSVVLQGNSVIIPYSTVGYYWYKSGVPGQLAVLTSSVFNGSLQESGKYLSSFITDLEDVDIADKISLSPNPFQNGLMLKGIDGAQIEIFDVSGKSVYKNDWVTENSVFQIDNLSNGIYLIKLTNKESVSITRKLVRN